MTTGYGIDPALPSYLQVVRKRVWWIALAGIFGLGAGLGVSLATPKQYSATAEVLVLPSGSVGGTQVPVTATVVQTDAQLVTSAPVGQIVARHLSGKQSVTAAEVDQTNVISITAKSANPQIAARIANAYGHAFVSYRQQVALGGVSFVTPAQPPVSPSSPKPLENGLLGLLAAVVLGSVGAFLKENADDTITSKESAERFGGAPVLAMVPVVTSWKRRERPLVVSVSQPLSPAAESYRSLRTCLQFARQESELRTLLVTSPAASEGKTSTVANLGVLFAQAGERVLLVSADLRRPRLGQFFGLDEESGLTSVMRGQRPLPAAIQLVRNFETLWVLGAGQVPPNPAEMLDGYRAREIFEALRADFDLVLIDSPPVLPVTDATVLSKYADAALIVSAAGQTKRVALARAAERFSQANLTVVGQVIGQITRQTGYGDGYGYGSGSAGAGPAAIAQRTTARNGNGSANHNGTASHNAARVRSTR